MELKKQKDTFIISGSLTYKSLPKLLELKKKENIKSIDIKNAALDTSAALFFLDLKEEDNIDIFTTDKQDRLFDIVKSNKKKSVYNVQKKSFFYKVGLFSYNKAYEIFLFLEFIGEIFVNIFKYIKNPKKLRFKAVVNDIERMGIGAIPIITIISFLIGVVISYHGSIKLKQFGANIFIVDLVGISVVREFGPLIVAILLAGRSSSSYTAQIGIMKVTEEVDVIETMGLHPFDVLVIPKILSMVVSLPILTILADIMGILGGLVVAYASLDITPYDFITRLNHAVGIKTFIAGMIKTPFFAFLVATIGSFKGFRTKKNVDSIGNNVTISVVDSIFAVIVADALFSILFSWAGI